MQKSRSIVGIALATFSSLCWAMQYLVCRFAFGPEKATDSPMLVSWVHCILCALCFLPLILISPERRAQCKDALFHHWQLGFLAGLIGIVGDSVLIFSSARWTTCTRASLLANTSPIFTVLLAALFLHEKISKRTIFGMILGFCGVFLVFFTQGEDMMSNGNPYMWIGDLMALVSGLTWAAYTVMGVPLTRRYDLFVATFIAFFWGTILLIPVVLLSGETLAFWQMSRGGWICSCYTGIIAGFVAFMSWLKALNFLKSSALGAFGYVSALLTAILSAILMHEVFTPFFLASGLLTILGVGLMIQSTSKEH